MKKVGFFHRLLIAVLFIAGITSLQAANVKTVKDLQDAFKGETTANAKYKAYAQKARDEGHANIAVLFEAASKAEGVHAGNHKAVLTKLGATVPEVIPEYEVKSTAENLKDAIEGESYEVATMYPDFLKDAQAENSTLAMVSFNYAYQVEKKHKALYEKALNALESKEDSALPMVYYVCPTCGNTYETNAPDRCGISMTSKDRFLKIEG